jgi:hypothetical protein
LVCSAGLWRDDLSVTWNAEWPQVLEAGWGLFATVIVGASFARLAVRPGVSVLPVAGQLVLANAYLAPRRSGY